MTAGVFAMKPSRLLQVHRPIPPRTRTVLGWISFVLPILALVRGELRAFHMAPENAGD